MLAKTIFVIHYLKKVATRYLLFIIWKKLLRNKKKVNNKRYLLFIIWKKLLRNKKKVSNDDICSSIWKKLLLFNKRKEKKRTCKSFQTTLHLMQQRWPGKKSCINSQTPKLRLLVKKKPQKNWFKQKQEVFFSFIYKKKRLANDQSSFFFFSAKRFGALERENKKASCFTKLFGFAFLFFDSFCHLGWVGQNKKQHAFFVENRTKEKKLFQEVFKNFVSLFGVKLS